jgi:hypothetical protein
VRARFRTQEVDDQDSESLEDVSSPESLDYAPVET